MKPRWGLILAILIPAAFPKSEVPFKAKVGFGMGNGYGLFGGSAELEALRVAAIIEAGKTENEVMSWSLGLRYYLGPADWKFRVHATAAYSTIHDYGYTIDSAGLHHEPSYGSSGMAGFDYDLGAPSGFLLTGGLGVTTHGRYSEKMKSDFKAGGRSLPSSRNWLISEIGFKYQF
ncbi:MAG: hypothetical protein JWP91_1346 [Fibrobacteres bacterium]|nr:hypothetical protein [Fibrobacterota bacterium]